MGNRDGARGMLEECGKGRRWGEDALCNKKESADDNLSEISC